MIDNFVDIIYSDIKNQKQISEHISEFLYKEILDLISNELDLDYSLILDVEWVSEEKAILLNKKYRDENYNPDVLSFPIDDTFYNQTKQRHLGDLVLNYSEMINKVNIKKNSLLNEALWCIVHGTLHLLGYDHENITDMQKMFEFTDLILSKMNASYKL